MVLTGKILLASFIVGGLMAAGPVAGATAKPAIVLVAFGTSTQAFDTYDYIDKKVKERYPGHEVRWAYTSRIVRKKLKQEEQRHLPDLNETLQELKAAGFTEVAIQSLHVVPGEEWEKKVVSYQKTPGMKIALGKPLLSSLADREKVIKALARDFPEDLQQHAVFLVGHGSPSPAGTREYLAFYTLLLSKYKGKNVFFGVLSGQPEMKNALNGVKKSPATAVTFVPLMVVAGDHFENDIMGDTDSLKSELLAHKAYEIQAIDKGLGYNDGVVQVFLEHLEGALNSLDKKKKG